MATLQPTRTSAPRWLWRVTWTFAIAAAFAASVAWSCRPIGREVLSCATVTDESLCVDFANIGAAIAGIVVFPLTVTLLLAAAGHRRWAWFLPFGYLWASALFALVVAVANTFHSGALGAESVAVGLAVAPGSWLLLAAVLATHPLRSLHQSMLRTEVPPLPAREARLASSTS